MQRQPKYTAYTRICIEYLCKTVYLKLNRNFKRPPKGGQFNMIYWSLIGNPYTEILTCYFCLPNRSNHIQTPSKWPRPRPSRTTPKRRRPTRSQTRWRRSKTSRAPSIHRSRALRCCRLRIRHNSGRAASSAGWRCSATLTWWSARDVRCRRERYLLLIVQI